MISDRKVLEQYAPAGSLIFMRMRFSRVSVHLLINWYIEEDDLKILSLCNDKIYKNSHTVFGRMLVAPNGYINYTDVYVLVKP